MPCAAGSRCTAVPDHTPGPPNFTIHPCKACGKYLHGTCGVVDPLGESEMHRVCHTCESSRSRETSGVESAGRQPEKRDSSGSKGKSPAGKNREARLQAEQAEAGQSSGAATTPPPPYLGVAEHFCELEDTAETCVMSEVSHHLRKAKLA